MAEVERYHWFRTLIVSNGYCLWTGILGFVHDCKSLRIVVFNFIVVIGHTGIVSLL